MLLGKKANKDPDFANVKILLHGDGIDGSTTITDEIGNVATVFGDTQIDTAFKRFGTGSILFDGAGDYLRYPNSSDWRFGTGDFTIECWARLANPSVTSAIMMYGDIVTPDFSYSGWNLNYLANANGLQFQLHSGTTRYSVNSGVTITQDTQTFIQIVRESGVVKIRIDGVEAISQSQAQSINAPAGSPFLYVGRRVSSSPDYIDGHLDDVRITKGVARSNVVPSRAFPDSA